MCDLLLRSQKFLLYQVCTVIDIDSDRQFTTELLLLDLYGKKSVI